MQIRLVATQQIEAGDVIRIKCGPIIRRFVVRENRSFDPSNPRKYHVLVLKPLFQHAISAEYYFKRWPTTLIEVES